MKVSTQKVKDQSNIYTQVGEYFDDHWYSDLLRQK